MGLLRHPELTLLIFWSWNKLKLRPVGITLRSCCSYFMTLPSFLTKLIHCIHFVASHEHDDPGPGLRL